MSIVNFDAFRRQRDGAKNDPIVLVIYGIPYQTEHGENVQDIARIQCTSGEEAHELIESFKTHGYCPMPDAMPIRLIPWPCAAIHIYAGGESSQSTT